MTTLEAYNQILALLGLPPVNSTSTGNRSVAILNDSIVRAKKRILRANPHVFGVETTLTASGGEIDISSYLRVIYPQQLRDKLTERNGIVWDTENDAAYTTTITEAVTVSDISFENISSHAWQEYITLEAAVESSQRVNDVDANWQAIMKMRDIARKQAMNEKRVNLNNALGVTSALRGYRL